MANALAEAAWAEADAGLAEAMIALAALARARGVRSREDALVFLEQGLKRAARRRGLALFGEAGVREAYDASRHDLSPASARAPRRVRLAAPGVARGQEIVLKARAVREPTRRARP